MSKTKLKNPALYKRITSQLYALHIDRECSITDISRATGIPAPTVARYLYGQPHGMTLHLLVAIAGYLGTTVADLMEEHSDVGND